MGKPAGVLFLATLFTAGAALPAPVFGQAAPDARPAQEAIALLGRFPAAVDNSLAQIGKIPVAGQWRVDYKCGFDCWGALCFRELTFQSSFNFDNVHHSLQARMRNVQSATQDFSNAFMPQLRNWAKTALPLSNAAFEEASRRIAFVQDEIARGVGSRDAQRAIVVTALEKLQGSLNSGKQQLTVTAQILRSHLERQRSAQKSLSDWSGVTRAEVDRTAGSLRGEMNKQRCQGDGPQKLDRIVAQMNTSISTITTAAGQLQKLGIDADNAMSVVLGTFVTFASRYEAVSGRLKVAKDAPVGSIIQDLHLKVARQSWQELVDVATRSGL